VRSMADDSMERASQVGDVSTKKKAATTRSTAPVPRGRRPAVRASTKKGATTTNPMNIASIASSGVLGGSPMMAAITKTAQNEPYTIRTRDAVFFAPQYLSKEL